MAIQSIFAMFEQASRIMTVASFATFIGIVAWTYLRRERDFAAAAHLPFADEETGESHV